MCNITVCGPFCFLILCASSRRYVLKVWNSDEVGCIFFLYLLKVTLFKKILITLENAFIVDIYIVYINDVCLHGFS